jgi:hypothetical protein
LHIPFKPSLFPTLFEKHDASLDSLHRQHFLLSRIGGGFSLFLPATFFE